MLGDVKHPVFIYHLTFKAPGLFSTMFSLSVFPFLPPCIPCSSMSL